MSQIVSNETYFCILDSTTVAGRRFNSSSGGHNLGKMCRWNLGMSGMCVVSVVFDVVSHVSIL